jgi:hypothetical protein
MHTGIFMAGVFAGLAGASIAAMAVSEKLAGTDTGHTVSRTAHKAAGLVSHAAYDAADTVDKMIQ